MSRPRPANRPHLELLETRELLSATLVGVVRNGQSWFLAGDQKSSAAAQVRTFGQAGSAYLSGDWNGDGKTDLIAVRPGADGLLDWSVDTNGDGKTDAQLAFGLPGDTPLVGDFDGDGRLDEAVVRANPATGGLDWYIDTNRQNAANPTPRMFGLVSTHDIPVVGDWNGDRKTDVGVVRPNPASGGLDWYLDTNLDPFADIVRPYGLLGDVPVTGDWSGDGVTDLGVIRYNPSTGLNDWYLDTNGDPYADIVQPFGFRTDVPVTGTWQTLAPVPAPAPAPSPPPIATVTLIPAAPQFPAYPNSAFAGVANKTTLTVDVGTINKGVPHDVAGALVSLRIHGSSRYLVTNAKADALGRVRFTNVKVNELNAGKYDVRVTAAGYVSAVVAVPKGKHDPNVTLAQTTGVSNLTGSTHVNPPTGTSGSTSGGTNVIFDPPPSNLAGTVTAGKYRVTVAQVTTYGATGNNYRLSYSIFVKATGAPVRTDIILAGPSTFGNDLFGTVGVTTTGKVVVVWKFVGLGGNDNRILMQMIDPAAATLVTPVVQASALGTGTHALSNPMFQAHANGTFSVLWLDGVRRYVADFTSNGVVLGQAHIA